MSAPDAEAKRAVLRDYLAAVGRRDVDAVMALMTDDISFEDPVGGQTGTHVVGRDAVRSFLARGFAASNPTPRATGPIRTTPAGHAAMPFVLELDWGDERCEIDIIDVVAFDASGRICELRAFWNARDRRAVTRKG